MSIFGVDYGEVSGGGSSVYLVTVKHTANDTSITTGQDELSGEYVVDSGMSTTLTDSHSATSYGGVFDFTLTLSSSVSVRLHSTTYQNKYFLVDVIKGGTTVQSDHQVATPQTLDYAYELSFGVLA